VKEIKLGNISIDVIYKDIKNVHLSVHPPEGRVTISAPNKMKHETLRVYAVTKLGWIKTQQKKIRDQIRETPREYLNRESHFYKGKRYLLKVVERNAVPEVELEHDQIIIYVRPGADRLKKKLVLESWHREQLRIIIDDLVADWEKHIGVKSSEFRIRKMKTRWGSCNTDNGRIWLNLELIKKPVECIEFIIVHELVHLLERNHNDRFRSLLDHFMPKWRFHRDELNRLPVARGEWGY